MPRSFRRSFKKRKAVYWDNVAVAENILPVALLDEVTNIDGSFTAIKRYIDVPDRTIVRSIIDFQVRTTTLIDPPDRDQVLEICVGIGIKDSAGDTNGQASVTTLEPGTGPLDDASNSHWMVRCCVQIPMGMFLDLGSGENVVIHPTPNSWIMMLGGNAAQESATWGCHIDTKVKRKLHGTQTPFINVAMQTRASPALTAGEDQFTQMNAFNVRWLMQNAA